MDSLAEIRAVLQRYESESSLSCLRQVNPYTSHPDPGIRDLATSVCTSIIRRTLLESFQEMDKSSRQSLVNMLGELGQNVFELFLGELLSPDASRRLRAVQILSLATDAREDVISHLLPLLRDRDEKLRATIASTLGQLVDRTETTALLQMLRDMDVRVRANAIEALGSLGNRNLVGILMRFRHDPNNRIRANALKALHGLGCRDIRSSLDEMVRSQSPAFRASAAWLIGEIGQNDPGLVQILPEMQFSDSTLVRDNMILALLKIGTGTARAYLNALFKPSEIDAVRQNSLLRNGTRGGGQGSPEDNRRSA